MAFKTLPPRALLRELLDYDAETGEFTWRHRPREMFRNEQSFRRWNNRYPGKKVGCLRQDGYLVVHLGAKSYTLHCFAWLYAHGEPVPPAIDHRDRDKTNNRVSNLRAATQSQNSANRGGRNAIGIKGIRAYKGSFRAHIRYNGAGIHLGTFATPEEAAKAYQDAAVRLHGEFATWEN